MKTIYLILLSWVCLCTSVSAEPLAHKASLQGKVTDAVDGSPVVGASIYFPLLKQGTVTNEEGFYRIDDLPAVKTMIQVSYVGHLTIIETIDLRTVHEQDFMLQENNAMLKETCEKNGAHYIEIAEALKGEDNLLRMDYSNDKVCHLNEDGIAVWIQCMKDYAQEQYDLGLWDPFAEEETASKTELGE